MAFSADLDLERRRRVDKLRPELTHISPSELVMYLPCLSNSQRERMSCEVNNRGDMLAAMYLFDILWKREHWYEQLLDGLRKTGHSSLADKLDAPERPPQSARSQTTSASFITSGARERRTKGPIQQESASGQSSSAEPEAKVSKTLPTIEDRVAPQLQGDRNVNPGSRQLPRQVEQEEEEKTAAPAPVGSRDMDDVLGDIKAALQGRSEAGQPKVDVQMGDSPSPAAVYPRRQQEPDHGYRFGQDVEEEGHRGGSNAPLHHRSTGASTRAEQEEGGEGVSSEVVNNLQECSKKDQRMSTAADKTDLTAGMGLEDKGRLEKKENKENDFPQKSSIPESAMGGNVANQNLNNPLRLQLHVRDYCDTTSSKLNDLSPTKQVPKFNIPPSVDSNNQRSNQHDLGCNLNSLNEDPPITKALKDMENDSFNIEVSLEPKSKESTSGKGETLRVCNGNANTFVTAHHKNLQDRSEGGFNGNLIDSVRSIAQRAADFVGERLLTT